MDLTPSGKNIAEMEVAKHVYSGPLYPNIFSEYSHDMEARDRRMRKSMMPAINQEEQPEVNSGRPRPMNLAIQKLKTAMRQKVQT